MRVIGKQKVELRTYKRKREEKNNNKNVFSVYNWEI